MSAGADWTRGLAPIVPELDPGWLVVEPPPDWLGGPPPGGRTASLDHAIWQRLDTAGRLDFGVIEADPPPRNILLFQPRSHARLDWLLARLAVHAPGSELVVAGGNRAGGKVTGRHMATVTPDPVRFSNRGRISLWRGRLARRPTRTDFWRIQSLHGLELYALPGVFGYGGPDAGTALLLDTIAGHHPRGRILDFGCGTGVIGLTVGLAAGEDTRVTFVDSDAAALASTRRNLGSHGVAGECLPVSGPADVTGRFDWILSNPPFHVRDRHDLDVVTALIDHAATLLADNGALVLVANRHLPLETAFTHRFARPEQLAENAAFKILSGREPKRNASV